MSRFLPLEKWKQEITGLEICLVNRIAFPVIEHFDYELMTPLKSSYYKIKNEKIKTYLKNRFLLKSYLDKEYIINHY